jgi:uncharacterized protein
MGSLRRAAIIVTASFLFVLGAAAAAGTAIGTGILHPQRRPLAAEDIRQADVILSNLGAVREDLDVVAPDGTLLRGWTIRPAGPNRDWVVLFHGVADNRLGVLSYAEMLLRRGYSVVMMDSRAHGQSGGAMTTYGWKEREDSDAIDNALFATESVHHLFYLGESMGAAISLQSAAIDSRVDGVVAEASFANLREVAYDYAGLEISPWIGRTLFLPAVSTSLSAVEREAVMHADDVSPEKAVAARSFPVLLICDGEDRRIPCRHSREIFDHAAGPKELWVVPHAGHTMAYGTAPAEFERRVLGFFAGISASGNEGD